MSFSCFQNDSWSNHIYIYHWIVITIFRLNSSVVIYFLNEGTLPFVENFTYKEIDKATNGFGMVLESGAQGTIYKARFPNGLVGAVKRVRSQQLGKDTFFENVQLLGRLHHRHLVRLKGFSEGKYRYVHLVKIQPLKNSIIGCFVESIGQTCQ